jgi:hypothetical protein
LGSDCSPTGVLRESSLSLTGVTAVSQEEEEFVESAMVATDGSQIGVRTEMLLQSNWSPTGDCDWS